MKQPLLNKVLLILTIVVVLVAVGLILLLLVSKTPSEKASNGLVQKVHFLLSPQRHFQAAGVREQVISALEKNQWLCEVVDQKDLGEAKKEFKLICNGRPFVAVWENDKLSYQLDGWSFLKEQPEVLKELQENNCRFYQSLDQNLSFICAQDEKVRKYSFSSPDFKLTKQGEELFLNEIFLNLWQTKVFPCQLERTMRVEWQNEALMELILTCQDYQTKLFFNFNKLSFTLPTVIDKSLTDEEKVQQSIVLLNLAFCDLGGVKKVSQREFFTGLNCSQFGQLSINYDLDMGMASFSFKENEFLSLFPHLGRYYFPILKNREIKQLGLTEDENYQYHYYLVGGYPIEAKTFKESKTISEVNLKTDPLK